MGGCDQSPVRLSAVDFPFGEQVLPFDTDQDESESEDNHDRNKSESK